MNIGPFIELVSIPWFIPCPSVVCHFSYLSGASYKSYWKTKVLRVVGGQARGRKLVGPRDNAFRPTTGRVKETIFSFLRDEVDGALFLDLFAGTGSLGIEALSRGAKRVVFVEAHASRIRLIRRNLEIVGFSSMARVVKEDVFAFLGTQGEREESYDLIIADPPFKACLRNPILHAVEMNGVLRPGGLLVIEHERHDEETRSQRMRIIKQRRFGHCVVSIYG